ncbi:MAG: cupin domain-containing protein [Myxococcota bacterium]|jgi:quercetin dioxygenase-like cupin family protein
MPYLRLDEISAREPIPGFHGRFVHGDRMTVAHWEIDAGAPMPVHSHPHEQSVNIIEGRFELDVAGERRVMEPGAVFMIPGGVPHSGRALSHCRIIDIFTPVREEYR